MLFVLNMYTIYLFCAGVLCCFAILCLCEPCIEKYCYANYNRKVIQQGYIPGYLNPPSKIEVNNKD